MRFSMKDSLQLLRARGCLAGGAAQMHMAGATLRRMQPFIPQDTRALAESARVQSGGTRIRQSVAYARMQYENVRLRHSGIQTHHWFGAMKQNGGREAILHETARIAGARGKG